MQKELRKAKLYYIRKSGDENSLLLKRGFLLILALMAADLICMCRMKTSPTYDKAVLYGYGVSVAGYLVYLYVERLLKNQDEKRFMFQMLFSVFLILWATVLSVIDVRTQYVLGGFRLEVISVLMSMLYMTEVKAYYGGIILAYAAYFLAGISDIEIHDYFSSLLIAVICLSVIYMRHENAYVRLSETVDEKNNGGIFSDRQQKLIRAAGRYIAFEWDFASDEMIFSDTWGENFSIPRRIDSFSEFICGEDRISDSTEKIIRKAVEDIKKGNVVQGVEFSVEDDNGRLFWFEISAVAQKSVMGKVKYVIGMMTDITMRMNQIQNLEERLRKDSYTNVYNKSTIERYIEERVYEIEKDKLLAMILVDIDDFKNINDTYGHPYGDQVIKNTAYLLEKCIADSSSEGKAGRTGGDEFAAVAESDSMEKIEEICNSILECVRHMRTGNVDAEVTCSIGVAVAEAGEKSFEQLYRESDAALYVAKNSGKNRVCCYKDISARKHKKSDGYRN